MEPSSSSSTPSSMTEQGKLFVGGISNGTKHEELMDYFKKYGEVKEVTVVTSKGTGYSRGFAFVQFLDPDSAERALKENGPHIIGEKAVELKRARPREQCRNDQSPQHQDPILNQHEDKGPSKSDINNNGNYENHTRSKKIFVGGLSSSVTEDEFKSYFAKFGRITDVVIMYDTATHRPRGFGFITFDSEDAVESAMQKSFHELNNKLAEVKIAVPKDGSNHSNTNNYNSSNYTSRMSCGKGSVDVNHEGGVYPPYNPSYGLYPGYTPPPPPVSGYYYGTSGYGPYGGGYEFRYYGGYGYGVPFACPRSHLNDQGLVAARWSPAPYGNSTVYPGYLNAGFGSYMGMAGGGYRGAPSEVGSVKLNTQQTS